MHRFFQDKQRIVTGLALLALLLVSVYFGGWLLRLVVLAASLAGLYEFFNLFWPEGRRPRKLLGCVAGALVVLSHALPAPWLPLSLGLVFWCAGLAFLFRFGQSGQGSFSDYMPLVVGILYIPLMFRLALDLTAAEQLFVVLAAMATDAGGYYTGMALGRRRMWESVSPKKTWEGAAGGMAACVLVATAAGFAQHSLELGLAHLPLWAWPLVGVFLNVTAQLGDFFESALKRSAGVKDSGALLPGHGGLLDRVDSILFAVFAYALIRMYAG